MLYIHENLTFNKIWECKYSENIEIENKQQNKAYGWKL